MKNTRLNVFLSHAGLCSRRKADELIQSGAITINHAPITDPAYLVKDADTVRHGKKVITHSSIPLVTLIINKPAGVITTASDEKNRLTITDFIKKKFKTRVYPVGRLDTNTTGALLLTNDGELAHALTHPSFEIKKVYKATLSRPLSDEHMDRIKRGVYLEDGPLKIDGLHRAQNKQRITVTIHSGRNRIIRRLFEHFGYLVNELERISFANITCKGLTPGTYRFLTSEEIKKLHAYAAKQAENMKPIAQRPKKRRPTLKKRNVPLRRTVAKKISTKKKAIFKSKI